MIKAELLTLAEKAARAEDYVSARKYCEEYLAFAPSDLSGLRLSAFISSLAREYDEAIVTISNVIELNREHAEPVDHFNRGRWLIEIGEFSEGVADFSMVIKLCDHYSNQYYSETAHLCRAIAYTQLHLLHEAIKDLSFVSEDCRTFASGKLYSKSELTRKS